jgi:hypothetical protein
MADDIQVQILAELKKQTKYLEQMDWKLWVIQNMFEAKAKADGYEFDIEEDAKQEVYEEPKETLNSDLKPKYDDSNWSIE